MLTILSDLHLTDESTSNNVNAAAFTDILKPEILDSHKSNGATELILLFLGDIFDLVRTNWWHVNRLDPATRPWNNIAGQTTAMNPAPDVEAQFNSILDGVLSRPGARGLVGALNEVAANIPGARLVYVMGNHDRVLNNFESLQKKILGAFAGFGDRISFQNSFVAEDYGVVARHGHEWDPSCNAVEFLNRVITPGSANWPTDPKPNLTMAIGEVITAELMSGIIYNLDQRISALAEDLRELNNLRPMTDLFEYLDWQIPTLAAPEKQALYDSLLAAINGVVECDLAKAWEKMGNLLNGNIVAVLKTARAILMQNGNFDNFRSYVERLLDLKFLVPDSEPEYEGAVNELKADDPAWLQYVVYGHTHEARNDIISGHQDGRVRMYINTGTYLPLLQKAKDNRTFAQAHQMTLLSFYRQGEDKADKAGTLPTVDLWNGIKRKEYVNLA